MTPKQEAAIRRHGEQLLAIFPDAQERDPVKLCRKLRRLDQRAARHFERMCSDESYCNRGDVRNVRAEEEILADVVALLCSPRPWLNGDPRGYALKVFIASTNGAPAFLGYAYQLADLLNFAERWRDAMAASRDEYRELLRGHDGSDPLLGYAMSHSEPAPGKGNPWTVLAALMAGARVAQRLVGVGEGAPPQLSECCDAPIRGGNPPTCSACHEETRPEVRS